MDPRASRTNGKDSGAQERFPCDQLLSIRTGTVLLVDEGENGVHPSEKVVDKMIGLCRSEVSVSAKIEVVPRRKVVSGRCGAGIIGRRHRGLGGIRRSFADVVMSLAVRLSFGMRGASALGSEIIFASVDGRSNGSGRGSGQHTCTVLPPHARSEPPDRAEHALELGAAAPDARRLRTFRAAHVALDLVPLALQTGLVVATRQGGRCASAVWGLRICHLRRGFGCRARPGGVGLEEVRRRCCEVRAGADGGPKLAVHAGPKAAATGARRKPPLGPEAGLPSLPELPASPQSAMTHRRLDLRGNPGLQTHA